MSTQTITLGTTVVSASLFTYFVTDKKLFKVALLLGLGYALRNGGIYCKCNTIENIGSTAISTCLLSIPGLVLGYPIFLIGEKKVLGRIISIFLGVTAALNVYKGIKVHAEKKPNDMLLAALRSTQKYLDAIL